MMIRPYLLLGSVALLSGCTVFGALSKDERERLTEYQQRASLYWESSSFDQSIDMANRGLEIEAADGVAVWVGAAFTPRRLRTGAPVAGSGRADPESLFVAVEQAVDMVRRRA